MNEIGYACIHMNLDAKTSRTMRVAAFDEKRWESLIYDNLVDLLIILKDNLKNGIKMFRISSDIIPLATHPVQHIPWQEIHRDMLSEIGQFIINNHIRVSMHPGQYTVLNSPHEDVLKRSLEDLEYHTLFLDALGLNGHHKIITHVGGVYGDKEESIMRFIRQYALLSHAAKARLVLENDDRHYNIEEVFRINEACHLPIVFDCFHHSCNHCNEASIESIMEKVAKTWTEADGPLKVHYSEQDPSKRLGAHAAMIKMDPFIAFYQKIEAYHGDVMIEAKNKNIAAIKALNCKKMLKGGVRSSDVMTEWARYKYVIMSYGYEHYKHIQQMMKEECTLAELYTTIEAIMSGNPSTGGMENTLSHVWGYLKDLASVTEKNHFFKLCEQPDNVLSAKAYLQKLCQKYQVAYILESYYFYF